MCQWVRADNLTVCYYITKLTSVFHGSVLFWLWFSQMSDHWQVPLMSSLVWNRIKCKETYVEPSECLQSTRFEHERTTSNIHKIFHSPIWFFNYEMILRTFNCTIVNQIKSSKRLVVKLKIRNLQLLQVKLALPYQGGCKGISSSEWSFAWDSCILLHIIL